MAERKDDAVKGDSGEALSPAVHHERRAEDEARDREVDIGAAPNTFRQLNKIAFSARGMEQREALHRSENLDERHADKRRDRLARIAAWDAQKTIVGGVEMTNAEAQAARQRVIQNADSYAAWAVRNGYLQRGQEQEFKDAMQTFYALKETERENGFLAPDQQREWDRAFNSAAGRAAQAATAAAFSGPDYSYQTEQTPAAEPREYDVFPSAPDLPAAFGAAHDGASSAAPAAQSSSRPVQTSKHDAPGF